MGKRTFEACAEVYANSNNNDSATTEVKFMLNHCLEWDKWLLNERIYPTSDSGLTHLYNGRGRPVV